MNSSNLIGQILFGSLGVAVFVYGKKQSSFKAMIIGGLLSAYPYFFQSTLATWGIGTALTAALFLWRD